MRGFDSRHPLSMERRRSQVVRQSSAKAPSGSSNLPVASKLPRIAVFGAGAIGGFIGAALAHAKSAKVCVVARGEHLKQIQRAGLQVQISDLGEFSVRVAAAGDLREFGSFDFILVTFKSHQWAGVLPQFARAVSQGARVVTLQNGLPFWYDPQRPLNAVDRGGEIARAIPREQIIGGVVHASGHLSSPGAIAQSGGMLYPIGELNGTITAAVESLSQAFERAGLHAPIEPDIRRNIWRKLVNNAALNPVSAITGATVRTMLRDAPVRDLLRKLLNEGLSIAHATGVDPGVDADERLKWMEHIADVKTSMLQDLQAGKPLELDPIVGAPVELAHEYGVAVPHLETVYALTKQLERERVLPDVRPA